MSIINQLFGFARKFRNTPDFNLNDSGRFDAFVHHWNNSQKREVINSPTDLQFSRYFSFGSDMSHVLKLTGKADYILENRPYNLDIIVYLQKIKGMDVRFELHFMKGKLFFISYTYYRISDIEIENVISALCEKYQVRPNSVIYNNIIIDKQGNGLMFEKGEQFSVNYLAPGSKVESLNSLYMLDKKKAI